MNDTGLKIFTGNANRPLAEEICSDMGVKLSGVEVNRFKDGEVGVKILESVRGADVFIIQPTCCPANDNLMELLLMIDAAFRASARRITAVMPYFGYSRQDRKVEPRVPISAKVVANLLEAVQVNRVLTMDLHAGQVHGFFDVPVDNLLVTPVMVDYILNKKLDNVVVVSPDSGGVERARYFSKRLNAGLAIVDKRRQKANICEVMNVIGEVEGKNCILFDDMIDTAGSISGASKALKEKGALDVYCVATHPVFSGNAIENLDSGKFKEIIVTNTIPKKEGINKLNNVTILSVASLFAEAIRRIHNGESVSCLFD